MSLSIKFKITFFIIFIVLLSILVININTAQASVTSLLETAGGAAQYDTSKTDFTELIGKIIKTFLSLLGVFFMVLTIYGGYLWMTAQGNDEQVKKARDILKNALIGLIIIIAAYAITFFVIAAIAKDYAVDSGF